MFHYFNTLLYWTLYVVVAIIFASVGLGLV